MFAVAAALSLDAQSPLLASVWPVDGSSVINAISSGVTSGQMI
jgi:hypothetical protein